MADPSLAMTGRLRILRRIVTNQIKYKQIALEYLIV
jgi:hypothetical protein